MKWILRYVNVSLDRCLVFDQSKSTTLDVVGYVDSNHGSNLDYRHSIFSYIFTLSTGAIS